MTPTTLQDALALFGLSIPYDAATLEQRYRELLRSWQPLRLANLSNSPRRYMTMYRKGEAHTRTIHDAYNILQRRLSSPTHAPSIARMHDTP